MKDFVLKKSRPNFYIRCEKEIEVDVNIELDDTYGGLDIMKYKDREKLKFITAEVCFLILIALVMFKCLPEPDYFKKVVFVCIGSFVCGTLLNIVLFFINVKIVHRQKSENNSTDDQDDVN